jgi:hypothetical protein
MSTDTSLEARVEQLEARLADLTAKDEIRELAARYQRGCDGGWDGGTHRDPDALTALFAPHALYSLPDLPEARGHEQIRELFTQLQALPWIIHYVANSILEVDGDTAHGDIKGSAAFFRDGVHRTLTFGTYHGTFVRQEGRWLFAEWRFVRAQQPVAVVG